MTSDFFHFFQTADLAAVTTPDFPEYQPPRRATRPEKVRATAKPDVALPTPEPEVPARRKGTLSLKAERIVAATTTQSLDVIEMISRFKTRDERAAKAAANAAADQAAVDDELKPFLEPLPKRKGASKAQKAAKAAKHAERREKNPPPAKGPAGSVLDRRGVMLKVPKHVSDITLKGR